MSDRPSPSRDARLLVGAVGISSLGDFLLWVPLTLHLQAQGASGFEVAALFIALWTPVVLLAPVAGLLVDRVDARTVLVAASRLPGGRRRRPRLRARLRGRDARAGRAARAPASRSHSRPSSRSRPVIGTRPAARGRERPRGDRALRRDRRPARWSAACSRARWRPRSRCSSTRARSPPSPRAALLLHAGGRRGRPSAVRRTRPRARRHRVPVPRPHARPRHPVACSCRCCS